MAEKQGRDWLGTILVALAPCAVPMTAWGQASPITMNGVPQQVIPRVMEVGLGAFTIVPGTGVPNTGYTGSIGDSGDTGGAVEAGSSVALDTMTSQSWGTSASDAATAVGVNPSALAATCMIESGCQNVSARSGSQIRGAFQMLDSTFENGLTQAVNYNPSLAGMIQRGVDGSMDPANQAISAAAVMRAEANRLQAAGISNPTALDVRGGYNFGPKYTVPIAQAEDSQTMGEVMRSASDSVFSQNGITRSTTVGEWRAKVSAKMGDAATQPVLLGV
ncbi:hypothetical protein [Roseomonas mucosa]|uniref:hypothetical protein n=1 Tax=Roseomonas mucosa TaxID=207340 RepID=UPI003250E7A9